MPTTPSENRVQFGFKNVYLVPIASFDSTTGVPTYGTPIRVPGGVSFDKSADTSEASFAADDNPNYFVIKKRSGISGNLTMAHFPAAALQAIWHDTTSANGINLDDADAIPEQFALLYEVEGDENETRWAEYCCTGSYPVAAHNTEGENPSPDTMATSITGKKVPLADGKQHFSGSCLKGATAYANWFTATGFLPTVTP